jgi:hypothetical protein
MLSVYSTCRKLCEWMMMSPFEILLAAGGIFGFVGIYWLFVDFVKPLFWSD